MAQDLSDADVEKALGACPSYKYRLLRRELVLPVMANRPSLDRLHQRQRVLKLTGKVLIYFNTSIKIN